MDRYQFITIFEILVCSWGRIHFVVSILALFIFLRGHCGRHLGRKVQHAVWAYLALGIGWLASAHVKLVACVGSFFLYVPGRVERHRGIMVTAGLGAVSIQSLICCLGPAGHADIHV